MEQALYDYILEHIEPEPDYLYRLRRATCVHTLHGYMVSGHLQGRLLKMLVQMIRPKRVLEVGTFSGYSALCMAEGLTGDAHLWTYEINDEMEEFARPWIEQSSLSDRITFSIGDANVQMILEPLGGGGNAATAGAQVPNKTVREVLGELVASIDNFYES